MRTLTARIFHPLVEGRTYREFAFQLSGLLLSPAWFCLLLAGWLTSGLLAITPLVMPVLVVFRWITRWSAALEREMAQRLLRMEIETPAPRAGRRDFWWRAASVLSDRRFWKEQAYLAQRTVVGFGLGVGLATFLAASLGLVFAPAYYTTGGALDLGSWQADTLSRALLLVPVGLLGVTVWPHLVRVAGFGGRVAARGLLGPAADGAAASRLRLQAVRIHAAVFAALAVVLVAVWAATTRAYFWPMWAILPTALVLAIHIWIVVALTRVKSRLRQGLAVHAGVATLLWLFLVSVWAVTGHGSFWPVWTLIGLGSPVLLHLAWLKLAGERTELTERIDRLASTRAGAVHESEAALRRIERDLHDGAQARLVALGMSLGMAEQKLDGDPDAARALVAEARAGVGTALQELRDLARGIHPPILTDRGLDAAVASLADLSPLDVQVRGSAGARPPAAVETAAYFVVAEALTNAAKHADARHASVTIRRDGERLVVEIEDDGRGGADPAGSGLTGLQRRVEALDGTFAIVSPAGGPTHVEAVLPCGW